MENKEKILNDISNSMMKTYQEEIQNFLASQEDGILTDADVICAYHEHYYFCQFKYLF